MEGEQPLFYDLLLSSLPFREICTSFLSFVLPQLLYVYIPVVSAMSIDDRERSPLFVPHFPTYPFIVELDEY